VNFDCPAQRILIVALRSQIEAWKTLSRTGALAEEEQADLQNDLGYAYALLSEMEAGFYKECDSASE